MAEQPASPTYIGAFDAAYFANQPPPVQHLLQMPLDADNYTDLAAQQELRLAFANGLATQGYLIDAPIMIYGWDAWWAMYYRQAWGLKTNYAGTNTPIVVSTDVKDFPPYAAPSLPPPPSASPVGKNLGGGDYGYVPGTPDDALLSNGLPYSKDPRGTFIFHDASTLFGEVKYFTPATT